MAYSNEGQNETDSSQSQGSYVYNLDGLADYLATAKQIAGDGRLREAIEILREGARRYPDSATIHYELGNALFERLREDLSHMEFWESLADDEEAAEECFASLQAAIERDPTHVDAYARLGTLLALRNRPERAIEVWEKSLGINPNQPALREDIQLMRERVKSAD